MVKSGGVTSEQQEWPLAPLPQPVRIKTSGCKSCFTTLTDGSNPWATLQMC